MRFVTILCSRLSICAVLGAGVAAPTAAAQGIPVQSSPIVIGADQSTLLCINPDKGSVSAFDITQDPPLKLDEVTVGKSPGGVAIDTAAERAWVTLAEQGKVAVLDLDDLKDLRVIRKIKVGKEPGALLLAPNGTRLYVANSSTNDVSVIDTTLEEAAVIATIDLSAFGRSPAALAMTNDGDADDLDEKLLVTLFYAERRAGKTFLDEGQDDSHEGRVVPISTATDTVITAQAPIVLGPIANAGFNSNGKLAPAPGQVAAVASVNPQAFNTATGAFPNQLAAVALKPGKALAYVVSTGASPNGPLRFNSNVQGLVSVINTNTGVEFTAAQTDLLERRTAPLNLNQGVNLATSPEPKLFFSNPVAIAWRPNGADAWIACQQADAIVRLTVDGNNVPGIGAPLVAGPSQITRVDLLEVEAGEIPGKAPRGIAIDAAGEHAYVYNYISRSITVVDISNGQDPVIVATVQSSKLPKPESAKGRIQLGAELFFTGRGPDERMSSEAWGSCASCHPDGNADGVTWMFPTGPRQTIGLEGMFDRDNPHDQRILNWSAVQDENPDFELNTRGVFAGRGLIDDDRLFLTFGGRNVGSGKDNLQVEQFQQFTGVVSTANDLVPGAELPPLADGRRDFAIATLPDDRVLLVGGRRGAGDGELITTDAVVEFDPRTNLYHVRSSVGFTPRHSSGAAAVITAKGPRVYAIGGYASTDPAADPVTTVEEYDPASNTWRPVAPLATAVAEFGIAVAGGINAAEPLQLIHVVCGNTKSITNPSVANPTPVQRFEADPKGAGTWTTFDPGIILRRNHGAAAAVRGVSSRIFVIGGQAQNGSFVTTVEEYLAKEVTEVATLHTALPAARAHFGIASTLTTNQIYVVGGTDNTGVDQSSVFEYTIATNGPVAGAAGTPSGAWVKRADLGLSLSGLGLSNPPGVTPLLPVPSTGRDERQDAIAEFIAHNVRAKRAPVAKNDDAAQRGRELFDQEGLVIGGASCATCHGGPKWTRSTVDYANRSPAAETGIGFGKERVVGAELRRTKTQGDAVLIDVGTFTLGGGRLNEVRFNAADIAQAIAPLGANGFNVPSLLGVHASAPYFYSGLAATLDEVLDGSFDTNGGTRHHFVTDAADRADLVAFLRSIDSTTPIFE